MNRRALAVALLLALPLMSRAHIGSPDVFFEGGVGPYPARVTIRMPNVVPGRAEISVLVQSAGPVEVSFLPLFAGTAVTNAPPPDIGRLIRGETNLYTGDLWLMSVGEYSIQVKVRGSAGSGLVEIPVSSVARQQLPMPPYLGKILLGLAALLVFGGIAIVMAAARDSALEPGAAPEKRQRVKGWIAGSVTLAIFAGALFFGRKWWNSEENNFREDLMPGGWPKLAAEVRLDGPQRVLDVTLGNKEVHKPISPVPDHGKLLHLFLIREGAGDAFAHLHPVRKSDKTFQVALPALPAGRYRVFCDLTFEQNGFSSTATNSVELPPPPAGSDKPASLTPDEDDSWAAYPAEQVPMAGATNLVYMCPGGQRVVWEAHPPSRARRDAAFRFEVWDAAGNPAIIEPYMGMMSHAAVWRKDAAVFAHLHPSGNFSMAAQGFFQDKLTRETGVAPDAICGPTTMDHSKMAIAAGGAPSPPPTVISLPYEFPSAGDYRVWVQFKSAGVVQTAVFDAAVAGQ